MLRFVDTQRQPSKRASPAPIRSSGKEFKITHEMIKTATSNKCVGYVLLDPKDFLRLTIATHDVNRWLEEEKEYTKTLDEYNGYNMRLMPWLDVDIHSGKVLGHEGRHRAAAVIAAGGKTFPVALCLREGGYPLYYRTPYIDVNNSDDQFKKVFLTKNDAPKILKGQYLDSVRVHVDTSKMKEFWAQRNR